MTTEELIVGAKHLRDVVAQSQDAFGVHAQVCDFLRAVTSPDSTFFKSATEANPRSVPRDFVKARLKSLLDSLIDQAEAGLLAVRSPRREGQLEVVSDFLEQAQALLEDTTVHPGAAAVLIGATVEEFLRTWVEHEGIPLGDRKRGIQTYAALLREKELITKQDIKDLTAWIGFRNSAAHGEWTEVDDRKRVRIMLDGVNLFLRQYAA